MYRLNLDTVSKILEVLNAIEKLKTTENLVSDANDLVEKAKELENMKQFLQTNVGNKLI